MPAPTIAPAAVASAVLPTSAPNQAPTRAPSVTLQPPMSMAELNSRKNWKELATDGANSTNECAEALLVALKHPSFSGRLEEGKLPGKDPIGNTDEDIFNSIPSGSNDEYAREVIDPWGTPVVYISKNNYGKVFQVVNWDGEPVDVEAVKRADGTYYNRNKFQLICLGKDGKQDDEPGSGDDIMNFKVEDDE